MSDDDSNNISKASSDDFVVDKGSRQITDDLSLSNPSTVDKAVPGSPDNQVVNERSVSQCNDSLLSSTPIPSSEHSQSPAQPPSPSPNLSPNSDGDDQSSRGLLDSRPPSCDENKNQDSSEVVMNINVVNSPKSSSSTPQSRVVDNLDSIGQVDSDSRMSVIDNNNTRDDVIVSNGAQKEINNVVVSVVEQEDENRKCTYSVPGAEPEPVNTETETSENFRPDDSPSSDLGALHGNNVNLDNSNQLSVQNNCSNQKENVDVCEKSFVPEEEEKRCDNSDDNRDQQAFVTVTSACDDLDNNSNSCSSVLNKCLTTESASAAVEEPPPLIREQRTSSTDIIMGNNESKDPTTSTEDDPVDDTVDDVNLDMFSDSEAHDSNYGPMNSSNGAIHVERSSSSSRSPCAGDRVGVAEITRTSQENRPKLMDMHLADFIFMDCDDEIESVHETTVPSPINAPIAPEAQLQTWNTNTTNRLTHSTSLEHPFSPPKIISEIFSPNTTNNTATQSVRASTTTAGSTLPHSSQSNNLTFWSNSKTGATEPSLGSQSALQSPPSCAFQMYTVGQGHSSNNNHPIAARIPMRSDHNQQQHNSQHYQTSPSSSTRIPHSTTYTNYPNNISMTRNTGSSTGHLPQSNNLVSYPSAHRTDNSAANIISTNFSAGQNTAMGTSEYKSNYGQQHSQQQHQNQALFTNDPQLLSQFVQYTKHFPLGRGDKPQDQTQISSSAPSSYSIPPSAITRGQYAHAPTAAAINSQQDKHSKTLPIKPVVVNPHTQQQQHSHHPMSSIRQTTNASVQSHQRQQYSPGIPQQQHQYQQHPMHHQQQNSPFQSQYRSSSNISSANGCDNNSKSIGINPTIRQQVNSAAAVNFQNSSNYSVGHGQSYVPTSASQNVRQSVGPVGGASGTFYPPSSSAQSQQMHIRQQQQHSTVPVQKELPSCSYANISTAGAAGTRLYNPSQLNQPNFAGANPAGSHNSVYQNNVGYNSNLSNTLSSGTARMSHSQNQQHSYPHTRPTQNISSSSHTNMPNFKPTGTGPMPSSGGAGWNPPMSARAKLLQVLQPNQNLAGRGPVPQQQTSNRMPYPTPPSQHHYRPSPHSSQSQHSGMPQQDIQQRTASVIAPRYPGGVAPTHGMPYTANNSPYSSSNISGGSGTNQSKQPSLPSSAPGSSPQMLRNPQFVAHFRPPTSSSSMSTGVPHVASLPGAYNQSVIRPNVYNSGNSPTIMNNSTINNSSNSRPFYGSSSSNTSSNTYYNNQASVIRPPQSSSNNSISGSTGNACTINRNSSSNCIVIERGGTQSNNAGQHYSPSSSSSTGYLGDLTLQSFLSNPSAPFMCPSTSPSSTPSNTTSPLTERSTSSGGSGYLSHNANWGAYHAQRGDHGTDQDSYTLSSCQYTDAMRRYNAVRICLFL